MLPCLGLMKSIDIFNDLQAAIYQDSSMRSHFTQVVLILVVLLQHLDLLPRFDKITLHQGGDTAESLDFG